MKINLDTTLWITPLQFAKLHNVSKQVVNNWIKRKKIESKYIEGWDLRLIRITEKPH